MISDRLKKLIEPQLKLHMEQRDWRYIPGMFAEAYLTKPQGQEFITLKPHPEAGDIAMQFLKINGTFVEITSWTYIKTIGEKL